MLQPIYAKTDKGRKEIEGRVYGLSAKGRRVLILVDAQKTEADLSVAAGVGKEIQPLLKLLLDGGFIAPRDAQTIQASEALAPVLAESASPSPPMPRPKRTEYPPEDIALVKKVILDTIDEYLGLLGADIKRRVEASNDSSSIISCIARWNLAMRESKLAKPVAGYYLQKVQAILD
ncbi:MAG: hypothetical protein P9F75_11705 [Candidatus Contendobacter sp.]|nr:hypothetical protein [Candidatus Contendobacter sp.]